MRQKLINIHIHIYKVYTRYTFNTSFYLQSWYTNRRGNNDSNAITSASTSVSTSISTQTVKLNTQTPIENQIHIQLLRGWDTRQFNWNYMGIMLRPAITTRLLIWQMECGQCKLRIWCWFALSARYDIIFKFK